MMIIDSIQNNGSRLIADKNSTLHQVNIGFYFNGGTLYENENILGISHLIEHLCFRRLNQMDQRTLYQQINQIGAVFKGCTYSDCIRFDITVSPKYFKKAFDIIYGLVSDFSWEEEEVLAEKEVVIRQIEFASSSTFEDDARVFYFKGTKTSWPIMGTPDSVKGISIQDIFRYKKIFLHISNCCCVLTGNFTDQDYKYVETQMAASFIAESKSPCSSLIIPNGFGKRSSESDKIVPSKWEISDVVFTFDVNLSVCCEQAVRLLSSILAEGDGSKLSMCLREEYGLTDEVYTSLDRYGNILKLDIIFPCNNKDLIRCLDFVCEIIQETKTQLLQEDLHENIFFFTTNQYFDLDSPRDLNFMYAWHRFLLGEAEWSVEKEVAKYEKITIADLQETAKQLFIPENMSIFISNNTKLCKKSNLLSELMKLRHDLNNDLKQSNVLNL